ncbi:hypothetical protein [Clostridium sp. D33t1_170424_F3]|uniref:hypothetical protein n=1 Tax=Clostridium sp. D33t1_170424_F3 TaxID=2787099 RepID=UPI0018AAC396|nr:hypothetical protein [Clostridium sp. D33t1_170424_F3]
MFKKKPVIIMVAILILISIGCVLPNISIPMRLSASSKNAKVSYIPFYFSLLESSALFPYYTPEEFINNHSADMFMGEVSDIKNIRISIGSYTYDKSIAKVKVTKVLSGTATVGSTVSLLMPVPINTIVHYEDSEVISCIRSGMTGIFLPKKYDASSYWRIDDAELYFPDIADYGLTDGRRDVFLYDDGKLIFDDYTYSYQLKSLQDVEDLIQDITSKP